MTNILNNKNYIAAVVIFYNPTSVMIKNVNRYINWLDHLYIIDNSEKSISSLFQILKDNPKIEYIFSPTNLGIARALNIAVEKACAGDFQYLLTMDQDSFFEGDSLKKLLLKISDENVGIYSPFHKNKYYTNPPKNNNLEEVSDVMTSGNILNLSVIDNVGNFNEDYFIDYVDIEFCLRLRLKGFKIIRNNGSFLIHNEANLGKKFFLGKTVYPPNHSANRWYYKIRNFLYLKKAYLEYFPEFFRIEKINIRNNIFKVILFEKNKFRKIVMMVKGFIHYKKHIIGKMPD